MGDESNTQRPADAPVRQPIDTDAFNRKAAFVVLVGIVVVPVCFGIIIGLLTLFRVI